jgi:hypothetical protein
MPVLAVAVATEKIFITRQGGRRERWERGKEINQEEYLLQNHRCENLKSYRDKPSLCEVLFSGESRQSQQHEIVNDATGDERNTADGWNCNNTRIAI